MTMLEKDKSNPALAEKILAQWKNFVGYFYKLLKCYDIIAYFGKDF